MPIFWFLTAASLPSLMRVMSTPSTKTWPLVGLSNPAMMPSRVDLPDPDGPTMATNAPCSMRRLMPLRMSMRSRPSGSDLRMSIASNAAVWVIVAAAPVVFCSVRDSLVSMMRFPFLCLSLVITLVVMREIRMPGVISARCGAVQCCAVTLIQECPGSGEKASPWGTIAMILECYSWEGGSLLSHLLMSGPHFGQWRNVHLLYFSLSSDGCCNWLVRTSVVCLGAFDTQRPPT